MYLITGKPLKQLLNGIKQLASKVSSSIKSHIFFDYQPYFYLQLGVFDALICKPREILTDFLL